MSSEDSFIDLQDIKKDRLKQETKETLTGIGATAKEVLGGIGKGVKKVFSKENMEGVKKAGKSLGAMFGNMAENYSAWEEHDKRKKNDWLEPTTDFFKPTGGKQDEKKDDKRRTADDPFGLSNY